jgi:hypothetical protein
MPLRVMSMLVEPPERVPLLLDVHRSGLAEGGERDLRPAVLEDGAPGLGLPVPGFLRAGLDRGEGAVLLLVREVLGVLQRPVLVFPAVVPGAARRQEVQGVERQPVALPERGDQLLLELREVAAGDDRDRHDLEQGREGLEHAGIEGGLRRGERVVQVEGDEAGRGHAPDPARARRPPAACDRAHARVLREVCGVTRGAWRGRGRGRT